MTDTAGGSVVILSKHPLLGEGIATDLATRTGVRATVAAANDPDAVCAALATHPAIVIYERTVVVDSLPLGRLAPGARLVDVTHAIAAGAQAPQCQTGLEMLAAMVRGERPVHT